jgi:hypothetical protein
MFLVMEAEAKEICIWRKEVANIGNKLRSKKIR